MWITQWTIPSPLKPTNPLLLRQQKQCPPTYQLRLSRDRSTLSPQPHPCPPHMPPCRPPIWPVSTFRSTNHLWRRNWILLGLDWTTLEGAPDTPTRQPPVSTNSRLNPPHLQLLDPWGLWWGRSPLQVIWFTSQMDYCWK